MPHSLSDHSQPELTLSANLRRPVLHYGARPPYGHWHPAEAGRRPPSLKENGTRKSDNRRRQVMSGATGKDNTQWRRLLKDLIVHSPDARSLRWFLLKAKVAREPERELCSTEVN